MHATNFKVQYRDVKTAKEQQNFSLPQNSQLSDQSWAQFYGFLQFCDLWTTGKQVLAHILYLGTIFYYYYLPFEKLKKNENF